MENSVNSRRSLKPGMFFKDPSDAEVILILECGSRTAADGTANRFWDILIVASSNEDPHTASLFTPGEVCPNVPEDVILKYWSEEIT